MIFVYGILCRRGIGSYPHTYVKVRSGKVGVLLKVFLNKATSDRFVNLSPIFTMFSIPVKIYLIHMSHRFLVAMETILEEFMCYHSYQIILLLHVLAQF